MKNKNIVIAIVVVVAIIGIVVAATSGGNDNTDSMKASDTSNSSKSADSSSASADKISIKSYMFGPETTTVKVGTTVTWTNEDAVVHTVTADTKADGAPDSGDLAKGDTYSFTFTKAGTFKYHCIPHPYMKATVVVTE